MSSSINCVFSVVAFRIECALDPQESDANKSLGFAYIRQGMVFLRQVQNLPTVSCGLRLMQWILARKNLLAFIDLPVGPGSVPATNSVDVPVASQVMQPGENLMAPMPDMPAEMFGGNRALWFEETLGYDFLEQLGPWGM